MSTEAQNVGFIKPEFLNDDYSLHLPGRMLVVGEIEDADEVVRRAKFLRSTGITGATLTPFVSDWQHRAETYKDQYIPNIALEIAQTLPGADSLYIMNGPEGHLGQTGLGELTTFALGAAEVIDQVHPIFVDSRIGGVFSKLYEGGHEIVDIGLNDDRFIEWWDINSDDISYRALAKDHAGSQVRDEVRIVQAVSDIMDNKERERTGEPLVGWRQSGIGRSFLLGETSK